jgi:hypothetical protein
MTPPAGVGQGRGLLQAYRLREGRDELGDPADALFESPAPADLPAELLAGTVDEAFAKR